MTDWATVSSLATAGATLLLAVGTFASVRSANRAARTAERPLLAGMRPVLVPSRWEDPADKITWADEHWSRLSGGGASIELVDGRVYLAMSLRNVGAGIAVLQGWHPTPDYRPGQPHAEPDRFRRQGRDLYVPAGGIGFWQGPCATGTTTSTPAWSSPSRSGAGSPSSSSTATTKAASGPSACSRSPARGQRRPQPVAVLGRPALEPRPAGSALAVGAARRCMPTSAAPSVPFPRRWAATV
jgi:hypothetical protein